MDSLLIMMILAISVQVCPTAKTPQSNRFTSKQEWFTYPCDLNDKFEVEFNDEVQLDSIILQTRTALNFARTFLNEDECINVKQHVIYKPYFYKWLPSRNEIPKSLGEQLMQRFLDELEKRGLDAFLLDAYEYMQKYAVGLEQIIWDMEDYEEAPFENFREAKYEIKAMLCELRILVTERRLALRVNVTREIMPQDVRNIRKTVLRDVRDCLIFRHLVNGLEFIIQVFEHFQQRKLMATPNKDTRGITVITSEQINGIRLKKTNELKKKWKQRTESLLNRLKKIYYG